MFGRKGIYFGGKKLNQAKLKWDQLSRENNLFVTENNALTNCHFEKKKNKRGEERKNIKLFGNLYQVASKGEPDSQYFAAYLNIVTDLPL